MSRKDPEARRKYLREYQNNWLKARRESFMKDKRCEDCNSLNDLIIYGKETKGLWSRKNYIELASELKVYCKECYVELNNRISSEKNTRHGHAVGSGTPTYVSWQTMRRRCVDENHPAYKYYGGKGVSVCERWSVFDNFLSDMGERPIGHTIDRINSDGNYEPSNCRWADWKTQAANRKKRSTPYK
jgi:hypothetical protein